MNREDAKYAKMRIKVLKSKSFAVFASSRFILLLSSAPTLDSASLTELDRLATGEPDHVALHIDVETLAAADDGEDL